MFFLQYLWKKKRMIKVNVEIHSPWITFWSEKEKGYMILSNQECGLFPWSVYFHLQHSLYVHIRALLHSVSTMRGGGTQSKIEFYISENPTFKIPSENKNYYVGYATLYPQWGVRAPNSKSDFKIELYASNTLYKLERPLVKCTVLATTIVLYPTVWYGW